MESPRKQLTVWGAAGGGASQKEWYLSQTLKKEQEACQAKGKGKETPGRRSSGQMKAQESTGKWQGLGLL